MMLPKDTKVRLMVDLTNYNPVCVKGIEGVTLAKDWNMDDCYTLCNFSGQTIKVVTKHLEIIDEKYLDELKKAREQQYADYLTASLVTKRIARRGGYYALDVTYHDSVFGIVRMRTFRGNAAVEIEKFLCDAGKEIEVKKET